MLLTYGKHKEVLIINMIAFNFVGLKIKICHD